MRVLLQIKKEESNREIDIYIETGEGELFILPDEQKNLYLGYYFSKKKEQCKDFIISEENEAAYLSVEKLYRQLKGVQGKNITLLKNSIHILSNANHIGEESLLKIHKEEQKYILTFMINQDYHLYACSVRIRKETPYYPIFMDFYQQMVQQAKTKACNPILIKRK